MRKMLNICDKLDVCCRVFRLFNAKNLIVWYFIQSAEAFLFPRRLPFILVVTLLSLWTNGHILVTLLLANATMRLIYRTGVTL
jgi:hypothetical protein